MRWERHVCQLMYLKLPDVLMLGSEHGKDIDLEGVLFSMMLHFSFCTSLPSSGLLC